jgi:hypothetical protein
MSPPLVGQNNDTFIGNARIAGAFPDELAAHLEDLRRSQEAEEGLPTPLALRWRHPLYHTTWLRSAMALVVVCTPHSAAIDDCI